MVLGFFMPKTVRVSILFCAHEMLKKLLYFKFGHTKCCIQWHNNTQHHLYIATYKLKMKMPKSAELILSSLLNEWTTTKYGFHHQQNKKNS